MSHPCKILVTCCGEPAGIDAEMARICRATWARGIHTQWCCQGDGDGDAELSFPDMAEADKFARVVFDLDRACATGQEPPGIPGWHWWLHGMRLPMTQRMHVTVRIPRAELPELEGWLESSTFTPGQPPAAEVVSVSEHAGMEITDEQLREYEQLTGEDEDEDEDEDIDDVEADACDGHCCLDRS